MRPGRVALGIMVEAAVPALGGEVRPAPAEILPQRQPHRLLSTSENEAGLMRQAGEQTIAWSVGVGLWPGASRILYRPSEVARVPSLIAMGAKRAAKVECSAKASWFAPRFWSWPATSCPPGSGKAQRNPAHERHQKIKPTPTRQLCHRQCAPCRPVAVSFQRRCRDLRPRLCPGR